MTDIGAETKFVFIRHAHATHNAAAEEHGESAYHDPAHRDAAFTEIGCEQLRSLRDHLRDLTLTPTAIYCSPLQRCRHTLLGGLPRSEFAPVHLDDRLMEPQSHVCNHRPELDVLERYCPPAWLLDGVADKNPKDADPPTSIITWIRDFTEEILARHPGETVLVVTHCTWIRNWFRIYKREKIVPANCEVLFTTLAAPREKLE